jgi:predicted aldo/keto reductase-like oxidoreductase
MRYSNYYDEQYSLLGYGLLRLSMSSYEVVDFKNSKPLIDQAIAGGVNYFDCAYAYTGTEEFLGKALAEYPRESYHIATKIANNHFMNQDDIKRVIDIQLKRLRTDFIDNYLIHGIKSAFWNDLIHKDLWYVFDDYRNQGIIKQLGFSFHDTPELLRTIVSFHDWDFAQIQLNYLDWTLQRADKQYQILREAELPIFVMEPLRGGLLATIPSNLDEKVTAMKNSPADLSFRYIAQLPGIVSILSGMRTQETIIQNLITFDNPKSLAESEMKYVSALKDAHLHSGAVPCSSCGYCEVCPKKIDIRTAIAAYNSYKSDVHIDNGQSKIGTFKNQIHYISESRQPDKCVACGLCKKACPQGIDIPTVLTNITIAYDKANRRSLLRKIKKAFLLLIKNPKRFIDKVVKLLTKKRADQ